MRLPLSQRLTRLAERLKDPEWRRYGRLLVLGKIVGIGLVFAIMLGIPAVLSVAPSLISGTANAQEADAKPAEAAPADTVAPVAEVKPDPYLAVKPGDVVNPQHSLRLVAAFLVFGMQVGFTMLEAGFCRSRETVNVLMECIVDTCLCGILFYAFGFSFMFSHGNGFIGYQWFFHYVLPSDL